MKAHVKGHHTHVHADYNYWTIEILESHLPRKDNGKAFARLFVR